MGTAFHNIITESPPDLIFFGGKGGVGKTTSACAVALTMASHLADRRILLLSTDPAHSLGDCFGMGVGDEIRRVTGVPNLFVRELDATKLMESFIHSHEAELKAMALRGTYFDKEDIEVFFKLSLPGADEVAALLEISRLLKEGSYDTIIVDTAPAGHTMAMLKLPRLLGRWIDFFELMQSKHHMLEEHFAGRRKKDGVDVFLDELRGDLAYLQRCLKDSERTEFVVVMTPQAMSLEETNRLMKDLKSLKIPCRHLIVNRAHQQQFQSISRFYAHIDCTIVPTFPLPVRGIDALHQYAGAIAGSKPGADLGCRGPAASVSPHRFRLEKIIDSMVRLLIVAGKGGVGKTTVAAATSLCLARRNPHKRFLILSIDPAHSLADILGQKIGNRKTKILDNLYAREMDSAELLAEFKEQYRGDIDRLFDGFLSGRNASSGIDLKFDREVLHSLLDLSPPGLDELMALHTIVSLWEEKGDELDCAVLDTAPTGHLLRFIEMPGLVREWLQAIFRLLIKYKGVIRMGDAAERLVTLSRKIRRTMDMLANPKATRVIAVAVPEEMIVAETERLIAALESRNISVPFAVANMVTGNHRGDVRGHPGAGQLRRLHRAGRGAVVEIPMFQEEVCGIGRLEEFGNMMFQ